MNHLLTPREWQRIALIEADKLTGNARAAKLVEAKRYGMLADELALRHVPAGWRNKRAPQVLRAEPPHPDFLHLWEQLFARRRAT